MSSLFLGKQHGIRRSTYKDIINELERLPDYVDTVLDQYAYIESIGHAMSQYERFFFLGRHMHVPIAYESALKLKEISYCFAQ